MSGGYGYHRGLPSRIQALARQHDAVIIRAAELFCLPSHQENFGSVVAEALACGLPVVIAEPVNISAELAAGEQAQIGKQGPQLFQERFDFASATRSLLPVLLFVRVSSPLFDSKTTA